MTDEAYAGTRQNVTGRAKDIAIRARDALSVALMEVAAWDFFKWAVIALLAMNLLVMLLFLGSIKSSLAELKDRAAPPSQTGDVSAEIAKQTGGKSASEVMKDTSEQFTKEMEKLAEQEDMPEEARAQAREALEKAKAGTHEAQEQAAAFDIPKANIELFRKHEDEIKKYAMTGLEMLL